jgi:N-methylhydantoinase A/oxoprolinase/acetone carboxylase beta subunit
VREDGHHRGHQRLLERKGEPTLLVTTRGFRDALRIAYQNRPACSIATSCCPNCCTHG